MCGIVGVVGRRDAVPLIVDALKRLEYRGYDSAGIALLGTGGIARRRVIGKLKGLETSLAQEPLTGELGIGHTRWATHGAPNEANAHPHATSRVAIVHNGIIENFRVLRARLEGEGCVFTSQTDSETIAHLVTRHLDAGLAPLAAAQAAIGELEGAFAIAMIIAGENDLLIGARRGSPLALGYGEGEMFLASDAIALAPLTGRVAYLEEGDVAVLHRSGVQVFDERGDTVTREIRVAGVSALMLDKGEHRHFMAKEIYEQPEVIGHTLAAYVDALSETINLPPLPFDLGTIPHVTIVGCGTAHYAGLAGKYWLEQCARVPVSADIASEFRYRDPVLPKGGLAVFVSQSGETADTLAALRHCKAQGQYVAAIVNVPHSSIAREADVVLATHAGPEIGVASTKAFTCQLVVLAALAIAAGRARGSVSAAEEKTLVGHLTRVPRLVSQALGEAHHIETLAHDMARARDVLYLGRGLAFPLALEGALKLKEISYIHAEGYAAGELKHGPIALIDEDVPVVVIAPSGELLDKTVSNMHEVMARGGRVVMISDRTGLAHGADEAWATIEVPASDPFLVPLTYAVPIQLLAYHTAVFKGTDVDQPRNLAKSVTVE